MQRAGESKIKNVLKKIGRVALIVLIFILTFYFLAELIEEDVLFVSMILFPVIIATSIAFNILKQPSTTMRKAVSVGLILGFTLMIINLGGRISMLLGALLAKGFHSSPIGSMFFRPLDWLFVFIFRLLPVDIHGILLYVLIFLNPFLFSVAFSLLTYLSFKHFVRKEKNENTKYIMVADIIFICLVFLSFIWFFFKSVQVHL